MPRRLLIVEDDMPSLQLLWLTLQDAGYELDAATSHQAALMLLRRTRYGALVLDVRLPDLDGLKLARALRAEPKHAGLPIIAVSAHALPHEVQQAEQAGVSLYLTKPVDLRRLVAEMARLIPG